MVKNNISDIHSIWFWLFSAFLSITWLLPNHQKPWVAFHQDAYISIILGLAALVVFYQRKRTDIRIEGVFLLLLPIVPIFQWCFGVLPLHGETIVVCMYLMGAALAFSLGSAWFESNKWDAISPISFAILLASIISVGLEIYQWLGRTVFDGPTDIWVVYFPWDARRPYANIGQPNQLASLLILGTVSIFWLFHRQLIASWVAVLSVLYLGFGIALTESRSAFLAQAFICLFILGYGMKWWGNRCWIFCMLLLSSWIMMPGIIWINNYWDNSIPSVIARFQTELRLPAWEMFLKAIISGPWYGYGWGRTQVAHIAFGESYPMLAPPIFGQAHNLFLDLLLWMGWPLGGGFVALIIFWFVSVMRKIDSPESLIASLFCFALLPHIMLEFPIHYGYFLMPYFFFLGVNSKSTIKTSKIMIGRAVLLTYLSATLILLGIVVRDYFLIEESYAAARFDFAGIGSNHRKNTNTLLLNHFRDYIDRTDRGYAKQLCTESAEELRYSVESFPNSYSASLYLSALAMKEGVKMSEEAEKKYCAIMSDAECKAMKDKWRHDFYNLKCN